MTILEFPQRTAKQIHVRVLYCHWRGEDQVDAKDSLIIAVMGYEVNGIHISSSQMTVEMGAVVTAHVFVPKDHPEIDKDLNVKNRAYFTRRLNLLRSGLTPEDWLEETTDTDLYLPVARMEWVERPLSEWRQPS